MLKQLNVFSRHYLKMTSQEGYDKTGYLTTVSDNNLQRVFAYQSKFRYYVVGKTTIYILFLYFLFLSVKIELRRTWY